MRIPKPSRPQALTPSFAAGLVVCLLCAPLLSPAYADPRTDYQLHCQGCHGPDGSGASGGAPSFRGQVGQFLELGGGREYLLRVPGVTQSELDDARTAAVLNWLLQEFDRANLPRNFVPFSASEVAGHRRAPLTNVSATRVRLLSADRREVR
jgi:hypothetical protein